ncbi:hypothetical protein Slin15195_G005420 [Septoria linicola]|uniref:Uncharacterized protein n=1 Tax=Septoria linicola TaxID=215465 RepID=A0A9Q9EFH2_9PEZI|nr:hypothetical protein Slin14017_G005460 [Septoria linicola]USW47223.1 hypothetical protein Slin15195_G005420 [Septoria linicola]
MDSDGLTYLVPPPDTDLFRKICDQEMALSREQSLMLNHWLQLQWDSGQLDEDEDEDEDMYTESESERNDDDDVGERRKLVTMWPEVFLGIIALVCPNLSSLEIRGTLKGLLIELGYVMRNQENGSERAASLNGIGKVESVSFGGPTAQGWHVEDVMPVFYWPSMKQMKLNYLTSAVEMSEPLGSYPQSSLRSLEINNALTVEHEELEALLEPCHQLRTFILVWHHRSDAYRYADWRQLAVCLIERNSLLEELYLNVLLEPDIRSAHVHDWTDLPLNRPTEDIQINNRGLGSLEELKYLRKLSAPYAALFGIFDDPEECDHHWTLAEVLPGQLEELETFCESQDFNEDDEALLNAPGTSRLRDIVIWNCARNKWIFRNHGEGQYV